MSSNAHRKTEQFFRTCEPFLRLATRDPLERFLVTSQRWKDSTLVVNLQFATSAYIDKKWPSDIDYAKLKDRFTTHFYDTFAPGERGNPETCVGWRRRKAHSDNASPAIPIPQFHLDSLKDRKPDEVYIKTTDKELVHAIFTCLSHGLDVYPSPIKLWGELTDELRQLKGNLEIELVQFHDQSSGEPYVLIL